MRVLHIPCYSDADPVPALERNMADLGPYDSIGVVGTAQHLKALERVRAFLESKGKTVQVGGQILGCNQANALKLKADCILYVGSGLFHPLGISLKTGKPVFMLNPISDVLGRVSEEERRRWLGRRKGALARALESDTFGIMVSTKDGQFGLKRALRIKKSLEGRGKEAFIFAAEELSPGNLLPFKVDCWVNTACPRIAGDEYNRPVINADELEDILKVI